MRHWAARRCGGAGCATCGSDLHHYDGDTIAVRGFGILVARDPRPCAPGMA